MLISFYAKTSFTQVEF